MTQSARCLSSATLFACVALATQSLPAQPFNSKDFSRPRGQSPADMQRLEAERIYQQGNYAEVINITNRLLAADPTDHTSLHLRASAKVDLGRITGNTKSVREGIADARLALSLAGKRHVWLYVPYLYGLTNLAQMEKRVEHADLAVIIVDPVLGRDDVSESDRTSLLYQRALAHTAKGDFDSAVRDYKEGLRHSPDHLSSQLKIAETYIQAGKPEQALAAYDDAIRAFPGNVLTFNDRGAFRRTRGDLDGAISDFTRALQLDPRFATSYVNRGISLVDQNNVTAAISDFESALNLNPRQPLVYRMRGSARCAKGDLKGAIDDYTAALKISPAYAGAAEERAFARFYKGDFDGAVADFKLARQLDTRLAYLAPWQFVALTRTAQAEAAEALMKESKKALAVEEWGTQLARYVQGEVEDQALLDATRDNDSQVQRFRECEAHFFMGQKLLLAGAKDIADEHFRQCLTTKAYPLSAYRGARYALNDFEKTDEKTAKKK